MARPITNHVEMGIEELDVIPQKLAAYPYYKDMFRKAFGTEDITMDRIGEAMSLFMTSITAQNTRFDQALNGKLELSGLEAEGRRLFNTKYECSGCHQLFPGAYGGGTEFINIGLDYPNTDKGAGGVMRDASWNGRFKIPNLRNVARTAPYMHDGRFATLEEATELLIDNPRS